MTELKRFSARAMLTNTTAQLATKLSGRFVLVFDDGEMEVTARETIYSSYAWDLHRKYPSTPMLKSHHVRDILGNAFLGSNTHLKLLGNVGWSVIDVYKGTIPTIMDDVSRIIYELTNNIYNEMCAGLEEYVVSMDILDYIEIMEHPTVKPTIDNVQPTPESIDECYDVINVALRKNSDLADNTISKAVRSGLVREAQVNQCLGPRGYGKDIDSNRFRHPILRGFVKGLRYFHDALIESRSAAMSLFYSTAPLRQAEYFARKLQILCQIVETIHKGDCGSKEYLRWTVRGAEAGTGGMLDRKCDLEFLHGKYYMDEETNTLKTITPKDTHLIGKTVLLRSPVTGCAHPDPHGICEVCFGQLAESIPDNTNIGHLCASTMTQQTSQNVLSTKHHIGSSTVESVTVPQEYQKYVVASKTGNGYLISKHLAGKDVTISISPDDAPGLTDLRNVKNVRQLGNSHVSEMETIALIIRDKDVEDIVDLTLNIERRKASFTYEMLEYIQCHGWDISTSGQYLISIKDWDCSKEFLELPERDRNMSDHSKMITSIIESNKGELKKRGEDQSPEAMLFELFDAVNSRLNVNLSLLEVIVLGAMVQSVENRNFNVPKVGTSRGLGVTAITIPNRSEGGAMAYEEHKDTIMNPASTFPEGRPSHPLDVFIKPQEAVMDRVPNFFRNQ